MPQLRIAERLIDGALNPISKNFDMRFLKHAGVSAGHIYRSSDRGTRVVLSEYAHGSTQSLTSRSPGLWHRGRP